MSTLARNNQAMAELGFIVVCVDGMGTAGRSKAFHNVSYKNMGKNLTDHVLAIKELAKNMPGLMLTGSASLAIQRVVTMQDMLCLSFLIFTKLPLPVPPIMISGWKKTGGPKCIWAGPLTQHTISFPT